MNIEAKMSAPIGVALLPLEFFLLLGFIDNVMKDDELVKLAFKSEEDFKAIQKICENIHRQAFPEVKDNTAEIIMMPEKKLITPKGPSIII
jgi:hypothetical protein